MEGILPKGTIAQYDGSYPLDRLRPPRGKTETSVIPFRKCTIRKWTLHNCQVASRRRCRHLLKQLPDSQWVDDFSFRVNLAIPQEIQDIEYQLLKAIGVHELVGS